MTAVAPAELAVGPFLVACALLVAAGMTKVRNPARTRAAIGALRLPGGVRSVRVLGAIEIGVGITGALVGQWAAVAVAACYAILTVAAIALWRHAPKTPCGCLGSSAAPADLGHVLVDAAGIVSALATAAGPSPLAVLGDQPLGGVLFLVLVGCAAALTTLVVDAWPALRSAIREGSG